MQNKAYIPHIDGLRALAVLAVVAYHLHAPWLPGGFTGVDVFFVISGYVVSAALARNGSQRFIDFAFHFYARRFIRIMPALLLCLLATSLLSTLFIPQAWLSQANENTALAAFFGLSNLWLTLHQDAYYSPRAEFNPFLHTWSLGVEEQFYFIFPFVFYCWLRLESAGRRGGRLLLAVLALASLLGAWWLQQDNANAAFYLIFTRFWELAAGGLLFQSGLKGSAGGVQGLPAPLRFALQSGSLLLIIAGLQSATLAAFPLPWALLPVLGTLGLIWSLHNERRGPVLALFAQPVVVALGRLSYSLYLWHWPVFALLRWTSGLDDALSRGLALILTLVFAGLSYRLLERPLRLAQQRRSWPDRRVLGLGIGSVLLAALLAQQLFSAQPRISLSVTRDAGLWQPVIHRSEAAGRNCSLHGDQYGAGGGLMQRFYPQDCEPSGKRLIVIGDSHAGAYLTLLTRLVHERGDEVRLYTQGGCAYLNLFEPIADTPPGCADFARWAQADALEHTRPGDIVFLPSLRIRRLGDQWSLFPTEAVQAVMDGEEARVRRARATAEAADELAAFAAAGAQLVLEAPKPIFRVPVFRCADWFNRSNPVCASGLAIERQFLLDFRQPVMAAFAQLHTALPGLSVWDPFAALCPPAELCQPIDQGLPLFFDGDHLSYAGNQRLYPSFVAHLDALAPK